MSETLWAVVIGGLIAIAGSAATQLLLFWLNNRKEKKQRVLRYAEMIGETGLDLDDMSEEEFQAMKKAINDDDIYIATMTGYFRNLSREDQEASIRMSRIRGEAILKSLGID